MKKSKRFLAMSLACILSMGALAGCSGKTPAESNTTVPEKEEKIVITAMIAQSRNYDGLQKMISKLKEEKNIEIECQVVPDDQYTNLLKMKLNSGEAPDMVDYNIPTIFSELEAEKYFEDLSSEPWTKDLISPENIKFDNKVYGYPFQSLQGALGFIYNKEIFDKLGITEPKTWEELLVVCEKIKNEGDGIVPIHYPKDPWVPQIMMSSNFATALGPDRSVEVAKKLEANELKWTEVPEFANVINNYLSLFEKGYVNQDFTSVNYDNTIEMMGTGKAAMVYCGDFFANSVLEAFPDAKLGMFGMTMFGDGTYIAGTTESIGFMITKNSKNKDVVKKIFELWATPEYGNLYFEARPGFPALTTINGGETPEYLEQIKSQYVDTGNCIKEFNPCLTLGANVQSSHMWLYYIDAAAKGNMTGEQVVEKFQGDFEKYMKDMKQPGF